LKKLSGKTDGMKKQPTKIEIYKENMSFSAGHFTIF